MLKKALLVVSFCVIACVLTSAIVPRSAEPPLLKLQLSSFNPAELSALGLPDELLLESYPPGADGLYIVQFSEVVTPPQREALVDAGARIVDYLPDYAYLVTMTSECWERVSQWPRAGLWGTAWAGLYQPAFKISPSLFQTTSGDDSVEVIVQQYGDTPESLDLLAEAVLSSEARAEIVSESAFKTTQRLRIKVFCDDLYQLAVEIARRPNVVWIEPYHAPVLLNDNSRWICQSYSSGSTPVWDHGIHGEGQIVGISDTGLDADMCFFYDPSQGLPNSTVNNAQRKTIVYYDLAGNGDWDSHGHGTHCGGTIAGDNFATEGQYDFCDGMAYRAKLVMQDVGAGGNLVGLPDNLNTLFGQAKNAGARIHSNSWGAGYNGYDSSAQDVDEFMWDNPTFLVVFAAGNSGPNPNTVGSPATAKNVVAAGASQNTYSGQNPENVASFSSNGPTQDGRMAPTVCAPGQSVQSAASDSNVYSYNCSLTQMQGTSMACPTTAGLAALVRQYYTDGYFPSGSATPADGFTPSAALVKATLVNSARNMTGAYTDDSIPSTGQGWGRILLDDALFFVGDQCRMDVYDVSPGLSTGQNDTYEVKCEGDCKLEFTLVWTDHESSLSASTNLVNDLDLTVVAPGSTTFRGNNYSGGSSATGGSYDRLNVVECVQIDSPSPGTYQVTVTAYNVPVGPQPYALVVTGGSANEPPVLSDGDVSPDSGHETDTFTYSVDYFDEDGDRPHTKDVYIDGQAHEMTLSSGSESDGAYKFETLLPSGTHRYYFYFDDGRGEYARLPVSGTYTGPSVDGSPPQSTCSCDAYSGDPVAVSFSASDPGSGVLKTELYYRYESGGWTYSGKSLGGNAGTFSFNPPHGEGTYYFYTIATDAAGNRESAPAGPDAQTVYDVSAPSSSCSGPEYASSTVAIDFTASDGAGSGVERTSLWFRYQSGSWHQDSQSASGDSGTFSFAPQNGGGTYSFYTIATDKAGNQESAPGSPDAQVQVETTAPQSSCTAPRVSNQQDISIDYTASDAQSGLSAVRLWYRFGNGAWNDTGEDRTDASGTYDFQCDKGDGNYYFYTIAKDRAGNVESPPASPDSFTIYDTVLPLSSCTAPECASSGAFTVRFEASDDKTGVECTRLYARFQDGAFQDTGLSKQGTVGQFDYVADRGEGAYYFYTLTEDKAGNLEDPPATFDAVTTVDSTEPSSVCTSPDFGSTTFAVAFDADDAGCGINRTSLLVSFNGGAFAGWGSPVEGDSGVFEFVAGQGDGSYSFYTLAEDLAGNQESPPASPDSTTTVDSVLPSSSCTCPQYSTAATILVEFLATDVGSQVASTTLWFRIGSGDFTDSGLLISGESGTFEFNAPDGEARYEFYTIALDRAGNRERQPSEPDAVCTFDATPPDSSCASPGRANESPFAVSFTASDSLSGVSQTELLFSFEGGEWEDSGLVSTGTSGDFAFAPLYGKGTYDFATVCFDLAGNEQEFPEAAHCSTLFDENMPISSCSSPAAATNTAILVSYTASGGVSGLQQVELWYIYENGAPQDSGLVAYAPTGNFEFDADLGDGRYGFLVIATNNDAIREQKPTAPDSITLLDTASPDTTCDSPQFATQPPITVGFVSTDQHSAIGSASLYYRLNGGSWQLFETIDGASSGAFSFGFSGPEGVYDFQVIAVDVLGNTETLGPAPCSTTVYDFTAPVSSCTSPAYATSSAFGIQYEASDNVSGVALVDLYYRSDAGGWDYFGTKPAAAVGTFDFDLALSEGIWGFATVAHDPAGNVENLPAAAKTQTVVDWTPPGVMVSAPAWARLSTLGVVVKATDTGSGFADGVLWYRFDQAEWRESDVALSAASDTLQFTFEDGEGPYDFWVQAEDMAGNTTGEPQAPQASVTHDSTPPASSCTAPEFATEAQITVLFEAHDALSDRVFTELRYSLNGGQWKALPNPVEGFEGEFSFAAPADGSFEFKTITTDLAGNSEPGNKAPGCVTVHDTHAPSSTCEAPQLSASTLATIEFSASDETSGVLRTALWASYEGGEFEETSLTAEGETGEFEFALLLGDGTYSFYTICEDVAGNVEHQKDTPDASLILDTSAPDSTCVGPLYATHAFILTFATGESASDIDEVWLYYKFEDGAWLDTGLSVSAPSGGFTFNPQDGDGYYYFATRARDKAGNEEEQPQQPDCVTIVDTERPTSTSSCDELTNNPRVSIAFDASDTLSGIASVALYYSHNEGLFLPSTHSSDESSGTFDFEFKQGDGLYQFYVIATDNAGNTQLAPSAPQCSVLFDTAPPETSCDSPDSTSKSSVEVSFEAMDPGSGVAETKLLYRVSGGSDWIDSGLASPDGAGVFVFVFPDGGGLYEFKAVSTDKAGNEEPADGAPCSATLYSPEAAQPHLWVSAESHDFGPLQIGNVRTLKLVVRNDGDADLLVDAVQTSGHPFYFVGPGSFTLPPGDEIGLNVFYLGASDVVMPGHLAIQSNDPDTAEKQITLLGSVSEDTKPFVTVVTDRAEYHLNDTIWAIYTVGNPGLDVAVDAYAAVQLPGDPNLYFSPGFGTSPTPISVTLPHGAHIAPTTLLTLDLANAIPGGEYIFYAALCAPGSQFEFLSELSVARFAFE
ncbi:MAG: S8 family serine peptidase [Candidatus Coatesbacteria bacterium]|nr:S8 family serine peptidase [Candidatus Coatesbacteria bacterium]